MQSKKIEYKRSAKILNWVSIIFILVGICGFLAGFVCSFVAMPGNPRVTTWARFPLGAPASLVVDSDGNIYWGSIDYSRIQVYSPEGKFLRGWFLNSGGGTFHIKLDEDEKLHVNTARGNRYFVFSKVGKLLHKENPWSGERSSLGSFGKYEFRDKDENIYTIRNRILRPRIIKNDVNNIDSVVVSDPFYLWMIGTLPSWFWIVVGGILQMIHYDKSGRLWGVYKNTRNGLRFVKGNKE